MRWGREGGKVGPGPGNMAPVACIAELSLLGPQIINRPPFSGLESVKMSPVFNELNFLHETKKTFAQICVH